ncbi:MAG: hypothetical protein ACRDTE_34065 [Pseudonocardiaceae bacterium]
MPSATPFAGGEPTGPVQVQDAATVRAQWDDAEPPERRAMLSTALGPKRLILDPAPKGRRTFDPARIRILDPQSHLDSVAS